MLGQVLVQTRPKHLALREEVMTELAGVEMAWDHGVVPRNSANISFCLVLEAAVCFTRLHLYVNPSMDAILAFFLEDIIC